MEELLSQIHCVEDLRALPESEMPRLAKEIRDYLMRELPKTGGHLASNLGVVELSIALHRVFDTPNTPIIWDVGHQSYVHKMLTGRLADMPTLRQTGGIAGFPKREESAFDAFGTGHSSTAISAAMGFAEASLIRGDGGCAVAVVGDGALTGGLALEGVNNCRKDIPLIIVINENEMSISRVTGAFPRMMSRVRVSRKYRKMKRGAKRFLARLPLIGAPLSRWIAKIKNLLRHRLWRANLFEEMGISYIGPFDGNDYHRVAMMLSEAKEKHRCVVVHLRTVKGKGYPEAEARPDAYHCLYPKAECPHSFHSVVGEWLVETAEDPSVVAISPATATTTGLADFATAYPERFFDVGIAEGHAVTFAAGLAAADMHPYAVIYSSFLQRSYDQLLHDVALQNLPVRMLIDRAGLACADGPTHHGIYDVAFLAEMPTIRQYAPMTYGSLRAILTDTKDTPCPVSIRYPNQSEREEVVQAFYPDGDYTTYGLKFDSTPKDRVILSYSGLILEALAAKEILIKEGREVAVGLIEKLDPTFLLETLVERLPQGAHLVFMEEGIYTGGLGMQLKVRLADARPDVHMEILAITEGHTSPETGESHYQHHHISRWDCVACFHKA